MRLDLQLFAEEEDMILPDDFTEDQPESEDTPEETQETGSDSLETEEVGKDTKPPIEAVEDAQEPVTTPQKLKIKFNHEEREIDIEEAAALAQKGMNYEKAIERARQEARDAAIADMGMTWNGKPITTEAEYKQALLEQQLMEKYSDLPDDVRQELIESKKFREAYENERKAKEAESKKQADFEEFFKYFESVNDRSFDPKKDVLPRDVLEAVEQGVPLKFAYMEHHNRELRNQLKIQKQNQENLKKSPVGSVTSGGSNRTESDDPLLAGFDEDY